MANADWQHKSFLEDLVLAEFQLDTPVDRVVAWQLPLSRSVFCHVFFNNKNQLFVYISSPSRQTLGDVQKLLYRLGVSAYQFLPPAGQKDYFREIASGHFAKTYPGRKIVSEQDLSYFKTLAPYNPALVQVKNVKNGVLNCFDPDAKGQWRVFCKLRYSRLDDF